MEAYSWPITVIILGIVFFLLFRKAISRLIDRTERITKDGFQAAAGQGQQVERPISKVDDFLKVIFDDQKLVEMETFIRSSMDNLHPHDAEEKEKFLIRFLAFALIKIEFDEIYNAIYGSQIAALQYMNNKNLAGMSIEDVRPFYDRAVQNHPNTYINYPFESWLEFLTLKKLLESEAGKINITMRGKSFLKFLIDQGYSIYKAG